MICPFCSCDKTHVIATIKGLENRRFRRCNRCKTNFETNEKVVARYLESQYLITEFKEHIDEFDEKTAKAKNLKS